MDILTIFKLVAANGVWAVLFLYLLLYVLRDSHTREEKYQKSISDLIERLEVVNDIKEDVSAINDRLYPVYNCKVKQKSQRQSGGS